MRANDNGWIPVVAGCLMATFFLAFIAYGVSWTSEHARPDPDVERRLTSLEKKATTCQEKLDKLDGELLHEMSTRSIQNADTAVILSKHARWLLGLYVAHQYVSIDKGRDLTEGQKEALRAIEAALSERDGGKP